MTNEVQRTDAPSALEKAALMGDLADLSPMERLTYYHGVCKSIGLNPLTKPFQYIRLNNKLTLYATKDATDQLRTLKTISIVSAERDTSDANYATWIVTGTDAKGRTDMDIGSVPIGKLQGDARANAIMKALTKAKRRLTLSLAGLGMLDESELGAIPSAAPVHVDDDGEVLDMSPAQRMLVERAQDATGTTETPATVEAEEVPDEAPPLPQEPAIAPERLKDMKTAAGTLCLAEDAALETGKCEKPAGHKGSHKNAAGVWPNK